MRLLKKDTQFAIIYSMLQAASLGNYGGPAEETAMDSPFILQQKRTISERGRAVPLLVRIVEILVSLTVLIVTAPIQLAIAIIIKRGTPGPALFFQKRVGRDGRIFTFVKFRTLYADAKRRFPKLYAYKYTEEQLTSLRFKVENDPRVSPQGIWLRKSTLDELPNFWNVLKGDMALVGPRPEIPEMLPYYKNEMLLKFSVRPGITGLAQISGRGRLSYFDTVALDLEYVRTRSFLMDVKIIFKTIYKVVVREGAF
jgi:lipopolysaccharide/colanic/teichoic acid biosynthesis glycosyltransferase